MKIKDNKNVENSKYNYLDRDWKEKNKKYLKELQIFFDKVDNIEDCELRQSIVSQMLICDSVLTEIAEKMFNDCYEKGCKDAKKG